jgi:hypothetical protein
MRALLCIGLLLSQILPAAAGCKHDPRMRLLTAITRYCFVSSQQESDGATKTCIYDCLISTEQISVPPRAHCPITVKQRLYCDGTRDIVSN